MKPRSAADCTPSISFANAGKLFKNLFLIFPASLNGLFITSAIFLTEPP